MKALILSDLHIEFAPFDPAPHGERVDAQADVVVLAGDIHVGTRGLVWARAMFADKPIVYVPGNHEFYRGDWTRTLDEMRHVAAQCEVHLLEDAAVTLQGVRFLGCTLWTDFELFGRAKKDAAMAQSEAMLADYRYIAMADRSLIPQDTVERHRQSRAWLESQLEPLRGLGALADGRPSPTVVVTHHYPSIQSTALPYRRDLTSAGFGSDLEALMGRASVWIHGHTHTSFDYVLGGTRVVCNPRGYPVRGQTGFENPDFLPGKLVDLSGS
jgi:predicted phosphodiesterase